MKQNIIGKRGLALAAGPLAFLLPAVLLPASHFTLIQGFALGTMLWMAVWWVARPVHIAVTALLPILTNACFQFVPAGELLSCYAGDMILLLFASNLLVISWGKTGLDQRIALRGLSLVGTGVKGQIAAWFLIAVILSAFLPNSVVCSVLTPMAVSMLRYVNLDHPWETRAGTFLLIAIAWGAGLGGFGTPLGGAMNLVVIHELEQIKGQEFMYVEWVKAMAPVLLLLSAIHLAVLLARPLDIRAFPESKEFFRERLASLGPMKRGAAISLALFVTATTLSFLRPLLPQELALLKPPFLFLFMAFLAFLLRDETGKPVLTWESAAPKLMWGMFLLFGSGAAIGAILQASGAAQAVVQGMISAKLSSPLLVLVTLVTLGILLCNATSNTAAAAVVVPIAASLTGSLGFNQAPYLFITAVSCNCAYLLPTSIRAITVGYGVEVKDLFRYGWQMTVISLLAVTVIGLILT